MAGEGPCMKDLVNIADEDFRNVSIASIGIIFIIMLFVLKSISLPVLLVSGIEACYLYQYGNQLLYRGCFTVCSFYCYWNYSTWSNN